MVLHLLTGDRRPEITCYDFEYIFFFLPGCVFFKKYLKKLFSNIQSGFKDLIS